MSSFRAAWPDPILHSTSGARALPALATTKAVKHFEMACLFAAQAGRPEPSHRAVATNSGAEQHRGGESAGRDGKGQGLWQRGWGAGRLALGRGRPNRCCILPPSPGLIHKYGVARTCASNITGAGSG